MVNYNPYAKTFSASRKNMKWEEIAYFLSLIPSLEGKKILDVGCGNGRLLEALLDSKKGIFEYVGVDMSEEILREAKKDFPNHCFYKGDMSDIGELEFFQENSFDYIFFIASFHHLSTPDEREKVIKSTSSLLKNGGQLFMTNWALESSINQNKYSDSQIVGSKNMWGTSDFLIKIGEHKRYYHSFSLDELNHLFFQNGYEIIENRLFSGEKNIITIVKKNIS